MIGPPGFGEEPVWIVPGIIPADDGIADEWNEEEDTP